ncbi:hypothetical protein SGFS_096480 [Streptomyces graminofaciens]|uniref:Uncharacterized protein n=2 Tax=Streptomyces graminofaciens TaxID=68212 RepID=A0ABM7FPZ6_9ACTN|nr:hypothetical protein SGFS_096480 [Streptomyces graminofaciens]
MYGPLFAPADRYLRQPRMPAPLPLPLPLDRVTGIAAEPGSMGTSTRWTETGVRFDSGHLGPVGRMPAGIVVEAGQAHPPDRGERVYRLLGCEPTHHGSPPLPGEALQYEVPVDGHGGVRLFFPHDCCVGGGALRLSMRDGQACFLTDDVLARAHIRTPREP